MPLAALFGGDKKKNAITSGKAADEKELKNTQLRIGSGKGHVDVVIDKKLAEGEFISCSFSATLYLLFLRLSNQSVSLTLFLFIYLVD